MFNTIILVIIAIICAIYFVRIVNCIDHKKVNFSDILVFILCMFIIIQARFYKDEPTPTVDQNAYTVIYNAAYEVGYENAIRDAILWESNEYTYTISFDGELHEYANYYHEDNLVPIKDINE